MNNDKLLHLMNRNPTQTLIIILVFVFVMGFITGIIVTFNVTYKEIDSIKQTIEIAGNHNLPVELNGSKYFITKEKPLILESNNTTITLWNT